MHDYSISFVFIRHFKMFVFLSFKIQVCRRKFRLKNSSSKVFYACIPSPTAHSGTLMRNLSTNYLKNEKLITKFFSTSIKVMNTTRKENAPLRFNTFCLIFYVKYHLFKQFV